MSNVTSIRNKTSKTKEESLRGSVTVAHRMKNIQSVDD